MQNAYFIPWSSQQNIYLISLMTTIFILREFLSITKDSFQESNFYRIKSLYLKRDYNGEILHIGELISGNNQLRLILEEPPENTYIYAPSRKHFYGVRLKQGSFFILF